MNRKKIIWLALWADDFCSFYLNYSLPTWLAEENISALKKIENIEYWIFTTKKDKTFLENHPTFKRLKSVISVKIHLIDEIINTEKKYEVISKCAAIIMKHAAQNESIVMNFCPDILYSNNIMETIRISIESGCKALMIFAPRLSKKRFISEFTISNCMSFSANKLSDYAYAMLHDSLLICDINAPKIYTWPSYVFQKTTSGDYVFHIFHWHPLYFYVPKNMEKLEETVDGSYMEKIMFAEKEIHFIRDLRQTCMYEISDEIPYRLMKNSLHRILYWVNTYTTSKQRSFFKKQVWLCKKRKNISTSIDSYKIQQLQKYFQALPIKYYLFYPFYFFADPHKKFSTKMKAFIFPIKKLKNLYLKVFSGIKYRKKRWVEYEK